jgi:hypothetical protein
MDGFENRTLLALLRPHRAHPAELGVVEAVHVVRGAYEELKVEGPVLAVLERAEAVEHQRFRRCSSRSKRLEDEETVTPEPLALALQRGVGDAEFAGDLAQCRATRESMKERCKESRVLEPVGGGETLCTEVPATGTTDVPLDDARTSLALVEALLLEAPGARG